MAVGAQVPLSRETVVTTALAIIDRDGVDKLNMRRLGETLGVSAMAVYHHFRDKDEILREVCAHLLSGMDAAAPDPAAMECIDWLLAVGRSYMEILFEHPNASTLLLSHPFRVRARLEGEMVLAALAHHGYDPGDGITVLDTLEAYNLGFGLIANRPVDWLRPDESDVAQYPHLTRGTATNPRSLLEEWELGCRSMLEGLLARLPARIPQIESTCEKTAGCGYSTTR